jgi:hypothetical protein
MGMSPSSYVLKTLKDIRPSELDEALLILPFSIVVTFFQYLERWARYVIPPTFTAVPARAPTDVLVAGLQIIHPIHLPTHTHTGKGRRWSWWHDASFTCCASIRRRLA